MGAATGAVLVVTTPLRGGHVFVLKHDVEVALTNDGLRATPNGSAMKLCPVSLDAFTCLLGAD